MENQDSEVLCSLGGADATFLALIGAFAGVQIAVYSFLLAILVFLFFFLLSKISPLFALSEKQLPFIPFMAIGAQLAVLLWIQN